MVLTKGYKAYKQHWEDQAGFIDKPPWDKDKILKLAFSTDFDKNLKELLFSNYSLKEENGKHKLRIKVPYSYYRYEDFKSKSLSPLGIRRIGLLYFS